MRLFIIAHRKTDEIHGISPMGYGPGALIPDGCEVLEVSDVEDEQPGVRLDRKAMRLVADQDARDAIAKETVEGKLVGLYVQRAGLEAAEKNGLDTKGALADVEARIAELHDTLSKLKGS